MKILVLLIAIMVGACCGRTEETEGLMEYLTESHITNLATTPNILGSFAGDPLPNLQMNDLVPGEYTIQFQMVQPVVDRLPQATYAIVHWKVRGQQLQRIISVFSGAVISGVTEAIDVQLLDQSGRGFVAGVTATVVNGSPNIVLTGALTLPADEQIIFSSQPNIAYALAGPVNGVNVVLATPYTGVGGAGVGVFLIGFYKIGVTLSKGTRPTIMQPPVLFTEPTVTNVASSARTVIGIPEDCGIISAITSVSVSGALGTAQAQAANGVTSFFQPGAVAATAEYITELFPQWFPVPPTATSLAFTNNSTTNALNFTVVWGIEG